MATETRDPGRHSDPPSHGRNRGMDGREAKYGIAPLVEHLTLATGFPTPKVHPGYYIGRPEEAHYTRTLLKFYRPWPPPS